MERQLPDIRFPQRFRPISRMRWDTPGTYIWSPPRDLVAVVAELISGGQGGSSNAGVATSAARSGGSGGTAGERVFDFVWADDLPSRGSVIVGVGGVGGVNGGNALTAGGESSFLGVLFAGGSNSHGNSPGIFGSAPNAWSVDGYFNQALGSGFGYNLQRASTNGSNSGAGSTPNGSTVHPGAGGSGAGAAANSLAAAAGGAGARGFSRRRSSPTGSNSTLPAGPAGGTAAGVPAQSGLRGSGDGGGGGAYITGSSSTGADGAWPGGGGGGAGGVDSGLTATGGNGAWGRVRIILLVSA
jgi:hypothetical protein